MASARKLSMSNCYPIDYESASCNGHALWTLVEIDTFCSLMSSAGYSLRFLKVKYSLVSGVSEKHICWFIAICLSVWSAVFVTWCSFTDCLDTRRCDPGSHCWSILYTQKHCPGPVDTLLRYGNGAWQATFQMATCGVTGTRGLHQGHALTQSLSDCLCHILKHFQVTYNQCHNCVEPFAEA